MFSLVNPVDPLAEIAKFFPNDRASLSKLQSLVQHLQHFSNFECAKKFMARDLTQRFEPFWSSTHVVLYEEARLANLLNRNLKALHQSNFRRWQIDLIGFLDQAFYSSNLDQAFYSSNKVKCRLVGKRDQDFYKGTHKFWNKPAIKSSMNTAWHRYNGNFSARENSVGNYTGIWVKQPYRPLIDVMSTYRQYLCISTILIAFTGALSTYPSFWWRDTILNWAEFKIRLRQQSLQMATDFVLVEVDTNTNNETEEGFVVVDKSTQT